MRIAAGIFRFIGKVLLLPVILVVTVVYCELPEKSTLKAFIALIRQSISSPLPSMKAMISSSDLSPCR